MRSGSALLCIALAAVAVFGACKPSIPRDLTDVFADVDSVEAIDVAGLIEQAEADLVSRDVERVRRSVTTWKRLAKGTPDPETSRTALTGLMRSNVWLADSVEDRDDRKRFAVEAVRAGQWCEHRHEDDPQCLYWFAISLGVQARERELTGLDGLKEMKSRLESVIETAPGLDHAGPHRVLAIVLLRAPGWPSGIGDPDLGFEHAEKAVELARDYPPNQLALGEALREIDEPADARAAYEEAARLARASLVNGVHNPSDSKEWLERAQQELERLRDR